MVDICVMILNKIFKLVIKAAKWATTPKVYVLGKNQAVNVLHTVMQGHP